MVASRLNFGRSDGVRGKIDDEKPILGRVWENVASLGCRGGPRASILGFGLYVTR